VCSHVLIRHQSVRYLVMQRTVINYATV
jgi:hypothetical protein